MNNLIEQQLNTLNNAKIQWISENKFVVKKNSEIKIEEDCCYIIKLDESLLNSSDNSVLTTNWNNNSTPKSLCYKADICRILGNMIKIVGVEHDLDTHLDLTDIWEGWLPKSKITVIEEV